MLYYLKFLKKIALHMAVMVVCILALNPDKADAAFGCNLELTPCPEMGPCTVRCDEVPTFFPSAQTDNSGDQSATIRISDSTGSPRFVNCDLFEGSWSTTLARCVVDLINDIALNFANNLGQRVEFIVNTVITLVFIIFGILVMLGQYSRGFGSATMLLAFKVIFVLFLVNEAEFLDDTRQDLFATTNAMGVVVLESLRQDPSLSVNSHCNFVLTGFVPDDRFRVFTYLDCVALELLGYRIGVGPTCRRGLESVQVPWDNPLPTDCSSLDNSDGDWELVEDASPDQFQGVIIFLMIGLLFFTGAFGAAIAMFVITLFLLLILAVVRTLYLFLISFMAIAILFGIAPIVAPTLLFETTKDIFKQWFQFILVYALQPVFMITFLGITLTVLDMVSVELNEFYDILKRTLSSNPSTCMIIDPNSIGDQDLSQSTVEQQQDVQAQIDASLGANPESASTEDSWLIVTWWDEISQSAQVFLDDLGRSIWSVVPDAQCLKWGIGMMEGVLASLLVAFYILLLTLSFLKVLPEMIDRMVSPGNTPSIVGIGPANGASRVLNGARGRLANQTSLGGKGGWSGIANTVSSARSGIAQFTARR